MAVYIEISLVAVQTFADVIGQPAYSENIASAIQRKPVIKVEAFAGDDLFMDRFETAIVSLE